MTSEQTQYSSDHRLAKAIVCVLYLAVCFIGEAIGQTKMALVFGTFLWFFGVNTVAHLLEILRAHEHRHSWL